MRSYQIIIAPLILAAFVVALPAPAPGCGFCYNLGSNPLALPHPKAIEIAVATRAAIDKGLLQEEKLVSAAVVPESGSGLIALKKVPASQLVVAWVAKVKPKIQNAGPLIVHFLFVDTSEVCGIEVRNGVVLHQAKVSPQSDIRVVTTKIVFHAILTGKLSLGKADSLGLSNIEGNQAKAILEAL
jgi:hypothetical protein